MFTDDEDNDSEETISVESFGYYKIIIIAIELRLEKLP